MTRSLFLVSALVLIAAPLRATTADGPVGAMAAWCTQTGLWRGSIEIVDGAGKKQTVTLESEHSCPAAGRYHVVGERFIAPDRPVAVTLKATFPTGGDAIDTAYFAGEAESRRRYRLVWVKWTDPQHWSTLIESRDGDTFEGKPAISRYLRIREGDRLESRKDVAFPDRPDVFTTRSTIIQTRVAP